MTRNCLHVPEYRRHGWTLIELLITVVILGISSFVLIPYATSGDSASGQSATRMVVTEILAAQMDAVATQGYRRIHFFVDGSGWCVEELDSSQLMNAFDFATAQFAEDAVESQGQNQQSISRFTEDNRFRLISIENALFDGANTSVIFDPTGGVIAPDGSPSTGGRFELHSGEFQWEIQLAPLTGKIIVNELGGAP
jgi:prepilin-type N-terminal cleavage/methylation domain-containing protein